MCTTPTVSFKERHRDPLRQIHLSRAVPAPFFKALPRFCTLQIFTYYNTYVLSSRHLRQMAPWQKQPLRKENTPLEPAGKVLNVRSKKQAKEEYHSAGALCQNDCIFASISIPTFSAFPTAPKNFFVTLGMRLVF